MGGLVIETEGRGGAAHKGEDQNLPTPRQAEKPAPVTNQKVYYEQ